MYSSRLWDHNFVVWRPERVALTLLFILSNLAEMMRIKSLEQAHSRKLRRLSITWLYYVFFSDSCLTTRTNGTYDIVYLVQYGWDDAHQITGASKLEMNSQTAYLTSGKREIFLDLSCYLPPRILSFVIIGGDPLSASHSILTCIIGTGRIWVGCIQASKLEVQIWIAISRSLTWYCKHNA